MEIWIVTRESEDCESETVALSVSAADAQRAAETYAGGPLEWEHAIDAAGDGPVPSICYCPRVGTLTLRGPFQVPFALPPYVTWDEERKAVLCSDVHGDFGCAEPPGHTGKHRSAPPSGGYFSRPQMEWD